MQAILIKNVPADLKRRLKLEAERNHRSMNQEALVLLDHALRMTGPVKFPKPIKPLKPITGDMVVRIVREGRR